MDAKRLIVVEDDFRVLDTMADLLAQREYVIAGRAQSLADAMPLIMSGSFDCAVLDLVLFGEDVAPLIQYLHTFRIPHVIITGTLPADLETTWMRDLPRLLKPFSGDELIDAIEAALAKR